MKKSSRIDFPVVFALAIESSRVFSQTMAGGAPLLPAIAIPAMGIVINAARNDKTYLRMVFLLFWKRCDGMDKKHATKSITKYFYRVNKNTGFTDFSRAHPVLTI